MGTAIALASNFGRITMTKQKLIDVTDTAIAAYQKKVRSNWIGTIAAIYKFGRTYTIASQVGWLNNMKLTTNAKCNAFTAAAKIGMAEFVDGEWKYSAAQVSRYSTICKHLLENDVIVDGVEEFLTGKRINDIIQKENGTSDVSVNEEHVRQGKASLVDDFADVEIVRQVNDIFYVDLKATSLHEGENLAVVMVDADGKLLAIVPVEDPEGKKVVREVARYGRLALKPVKSTDSADNDELEEAA